MNNKRYIIEKIIGETPLQALTRLRDKEQIPASIPLAYAGRLDPMASGKLLVLAGDECKNQKTYHALDKAYDFEILFGFTSDTGDILGKAKEFPTLFISPESIEKSLAQLPKDLSLPYPIFSSKTVRGKPLFLWELEGRIAEIEIPIATTALYTIRYTGSTTIRSNELLSQIELRINALPVVQEESKKLGANFRREDILKEWRTLLLKNPHGTFQIVKCTTVVSSGTYIRSLAPHVAETLGTVGLAFSIHRTTIGRYARITARRGFWWKKYT